MNIVIPDKYKLKDYQIDDVKFIVKRQKVLLSHEMGLGKTIITIASINTINKNIKPLTNILIVVPKILLSKWEKTLQDWLVDDELKNNIYVITSNSSNKYLNIIKHGIIIINYDILYKKREFLYQFDFDMIVLDECQYIKNRKLSSTKTIIGGIVNKQRLKMLNAKYKIALSGTPIKQTPSDLWPVLKWLDKKQFGNWYSFAKRYCGLEQTKYGYLKETGPQNIDELYKKLVNTVMIRRTRKSVGIMSNKIVNTIYLTPNAKTMQQYNKLLNDKYVNIENEIKEAIDKLNDNKITTDEFVLFFNSKRKELIKFKDLSTIKKKLGILKAPYIIKYINDKLNEFKKIVVFVYHVDVGNILSSFFGCDFIHGGLTPKQKDNMINNFKSNEDIQILVCNIQVANMGIDLDISNYLIFGELDWRAMDLEQAESRIIRLTQTKQPIIDYLILQNTLDEYIGTVIVNKRELFKSVIDNTMNIEEYDIANDLFD